jgi:branched-chain amino acid transport system permease protein
VRGRRALYTSYASDQAPLNTPAKRLWTGIAVAALVLLPFATTAEITALFATAFVSAVGAIGLNVVTGYAGQVSLGHAFFMGIGAYTAAVLGGERTFSVVGYGLDIWVWLPAAGIAAAIVGFVVAPLAARLKGLYLAIVTLGLVFVGEHIFREAESVTGGIGTGRSAARLAFMGERFDRRMTIGSLDVTRETKLYFLALLVLAILALLSHNLTRSAIGRAFAAVRDRDIAAEVMGVGLLRHKVIAFGVSSFYAGIAGALLATVTGFIEPTTYNLLLSVQFLAMVLIGGVATLTGSLFGAAVVVLLPRLVQEVPRFVPFVSGESSGGVITTFQLQTLLYGVAIVVFLILEPRGLFGLWVRVRNYWRAWPFSY